MIDIAKLKELVALMAEHDLAEVDIKNGEEAVTIKRGMGQGGMPLVQYAQPSYQAPAPGQNSAAPPPAPIPAAPPGVTIESPMVGTLYLGPNPDSPPFVKPGASVTPDTVVCLIEAMKVFNEIKAEKSGVLEHILVKNGEAVEFGQKLFALRPA
jgi:acetyl-CoA carboxylase biotin carboxyl carrier protein